MNDSAAILARNAATAAEQKNETAVPSFYHAAPASHKRPRRRSDHDLLLPAFGDPSPAPCAALHRKRDHDA